MSVVRYSAPILDRKKQEFLELDRCTRKLLTMQQAFLPISTVDRLYNSRNKGGRGLYRIADTIETSKIGLESYIQEKNERL